MEYPIQTWTLERAVEAVRSHPLGVPALIVAGMVLGVVLWLHGGRTLRGAFILLGGVGGAVAGVLAAPRLGVGDAGPMTGGMVCGIGGSIVGVLAALVTFRMAIGTSLACALGAAAMALVLMSDAPAGMHLGSIPTAAVETEGEGSGLIARAMERARQGAETAGSQVAAGWRAMPDEARLRLVGAGAIGALAGLWVGLAMPRRSAAVVTALAGPGLVLGFGALLARELGTPMASRYGPAAWGVLWGAMALVGLIVQAGSLRRTTA